MNFTTLTNDPATSVACTECYGGIYKMETDGAMAGLTTLLWKGENNVDIITNPIAYADGYLYTATSLGLKPYTFGLQIGPTNFDNPAYPRKVYKIDVTTGELVWEKSLDYYLNAFDIRDGYIYAGGSTGGGVTESVFTHKGEVALVRVSTETGELETLLVAPELQNAYIAAAKFVGDKLMFLTDKIWSVDYNIWTKNIKPNTLQVAFDFEDPEMVTVSEYFIGLVESPTERLSFLDNAVMHPDGKRFLVSSNTHLFTFRVNKNKTKWYWFFSCAAIPVVIGAGMLKVRHGRKTTDREKMTQIELDENELEMTPNPVANAIV